MKKYLTVFFFLVFASLFFAVQAETQAIRPATSFSEEDYDRILLAVRTGKGFREGDFFLFKGFTENMLLKCESLVGPKQLRHIPEALVRKTRYYSDVSEWELSLGFVLELAQYPNPQTSIHLRLLKIYGFSSVVKPYEEHCRRLKKIRETMRNYRTATSPQALKEDPDEVEDAFRIFCEALEEIGTEEKTMMEQLVVAEHGLMLGIALQQNLIRNLSFLPIRTPREREALNRFLVDPLDPLLLDECRNAFGNSRFIPEFVKLFPNARGLWNTSPPVNRREMTDLWHNSIRTFQKHKDYSAKGEFESWGNCYLSLLWMVQDWKCAFLLEQQFQNALIAYKQDFF